MTASVCPICGQPCEVSEAWHCGNPAVLYRCEGCKGTIRFEKTGECFRLDREGVKGKVQVATT